MESAIRFGKKNQAVSLVSSDQRNTGMTNGILLVQPQRGQLSVLDMQAKVIRHPHLPCIRN